MGKARDDPILAAPFANAERPPSALRREIRRRGLGLPWGSSRLHPLSWASSPPIARSPPHQTHAEAAEALCFGYGPIEKGFDAHPASGLMRSLNHPYAPWRFQNSEGVTMA